MKDMSTSQLEKPGCLIIAEIGSLYSDIIHALRTGWEPGVDLETGIADTIGYFRKFTDRE